MAILLRVGSAPPTHVVYESAGRCGCPKENEAIGERYNLVKVQDGIYPSRQR
ncbi:hypothetical protein [Bellilinea caldifistulae]|uniref:hypothetical protein n=1 Tax=Bellilinea caldifistulae TaxID=360411 RepID=UPI0012F829C8|nr:hypothetical protein [Bellilinea caldifistulae]